MKEYDENNLIDKYKQLLYLDYKEEIQELKKTNSNFNDSIFELKKG